AFFGSQRIFTEEPTFAGNTVPGFGHVFDSDRGVLTAGYTHIFGPALLNEVRFGRNPLSGTATPVASLNPADYGIRDGSERPIGLPQIVVAGGLNSGGPSGFPTGRDDTSYILADTVTRVSGRHSMRMGGESRRFLNENFTEGTGLFNFPSVPAFLA